MSHASNEISNELAETASLTDVDRHRLLASERRRHTLDVLETESGPVELYELAQAVAGRERVTTSPKAAIERIALSLHHNHLPKLDDFGVVDYDPKRNLVESSQFEE